MLTFKRLIVIFYDILTIPAAWFGAYWVRGNLSELPYRIWDDSIHLVIVIILVQTITFWVYGLYRGQWRFASLHDLVRICRAVVIGSILNLIALYFVSYHLIHTNDMPPRSIMVLYAILLIFFLGGARLFIRWVKEFKNARNFNKSVLIVGAGMAGESLIRELRRDHAKNYFPKVLVDDDPQKQGMEISGVRVRGGIADIGALVKRYAIEQILIALPSANSITMRHIVEQCAASGVPYRTLPGLSSLATGKVEVKALREVSLEDLLGREVIHIEEHSLQQAFNGKKVLVTGGGGSIGSELCRQVAEYQPEELIICDHSEYNLYEIDLYLRKHFPQLSLKAALINITDAGSVDKLMQQYSPNVVFHAAAYKHVPLLEQQALVAVNNNIIGTKIVAEAAVKHHVEKFVLISTDKAVNPTNIMGASKRVAEIFCQNLNRQSDTNFITVRFGNVLGSAGSVVPLFKKQLAQGGPLTVTHKDITRYFMTIPEACQLILQASILGAGGEIFVLDMGEPVKISFLAEQLIRLSGKVPGTDIAIEYTGLRPGEKLYEELFHEAELLQNTIHKKIFKAKSRIVDEQELHASIQALQQTYVNKQLDEAKAIIKVLVPESNFNL